MQNLATKNIRRTTKEDRLGVLVDVRWWRVEDEMMKVEEPVFKPDNSYTLQSEDAARFKLTFQLLIMTAKRSKTLSVHYRVKKYHLISKWMTVKDLAANPQAGFHYSSLSLSIWGCSRVCCWRWQRQWKWMETTANLWLAFGLILTLTARLKKTSPIDKLNV